MPSPANAAADTAISPAILEGRNIVFSYRNHPVLNGVDFSVRPGEVVALLGVNGAGKSTLLRLLLGFERPSAGTVLLDGRPIASYPRAAIAKRMAYVPQNHVSPFPYRVRDIVAMGRYSHSGVFGRRGQGDSTIIDEGMERLGISHLADRAYTQISGGERQLTLLCRALVQGALLLILDEPASALDFGNQVRLLAHLERLAGEGYGVVMTTHHPDHALMVANRVVLMRQGRIMADGAPAKTLTPQTLEQLYGISSAEIATFLKRRQGLGYPC